MRLIGIALLAAMQATCVFAQEDAGAAQRNWEGAYVGGSIQYGHVEALAIGDWAAWIETYYSGTKGPVLGNPDGTTASVRAGYDAQFGALVLGAGLEYFIGTYEGPFVDQPDSSGEMRDLLTVFGRVGIDAGPVMPYALAGLTLGEGEYTGKFTNPTVTHHKQDDLSGYSLGLGAEIRLHENWTAHIEYVHTDFGKQAEFEDNMVIDLDQIKIGLNYRF
jgi:outer membrane immunogenic protein